MRSISLCCFAIAAVPGFASAQQKSARAFTPSDWYRLTAVAAPALSPDGKLVAFTVTTVKEAENRRHSEVWVVPTTGGEPSRYTTPGVESSAPRFSPDGKYLRFTSSRPGGKGSIWLLRLDQPGGEAFQAETVPMGSTPADHRFAVWTEATPRDSAADSAKKSDPFATMLPMARPPYGAITKPVDARRFDGRQITDMRYKGNDAGFIPGSREKRSWRPAQLWMQAYGDSAKKQITSTRYSHLEAAVSPDGKWVAFIADSRLRPDSVIDAERDSIAKLPYDPKRDEMERNDVDIFVMPLAGGEPKHLVAYPGNESNLAWSPDGKRLAFIGRPGRTKSARLYVADVDPSGAPATPVNAVADWKPEPESFAWLSPIQLAANAEKGGSSGLFLVTPATREVREILGGRRRMSGFSYDTARRQVAFIATSLTAPTEVFVSDIDGKNERRLTHFNDKLSSEIAWSDAERFTYPSVGGLQIEGWLMKPYGYQAGRKYPLVLYIHGGPHSAYGENWFDEFQNLSAAGMWVLFTNPRGSSGYGADFTFATRGRWGAEDYEDLMKAVDIAARRPDVDSARMGVTGGSYGGFMTAWIETKTRRFKAAETDRMISEWTYWYGASDAQGLTEFEFYGKPWDNWSLYDRLSPIRYVNRVKTPTLMVQSEDDFRTPMGNAELWYMALKKHGVPVEFIRYPRSTHELSRSGEPWLLVDRLGRLRQWFGYWLMDQGAAPLTTATSGADARR
ncbi:MAG: S9 family peptidase [Gemmatimonadota bacterium]|nr:S9 family peptidase [Gemmatimonadota bacterium]